MAPGDPCLQCGLPVPASKRARPRKFCSAKCQLFWNNTRRNRKGEDDWGKKNPEKKRIYRRRWIKAHPEVKRAAKKRHYQRYRDIILLLKQLRRRGMVTPEELERLIQKRKEKG